MESGPVRELSDRRLRPVSRIDSDTAELPPVVDWGDFPAISSGDGILDGGLLFWGCSMLSVDRSHFGNVDAGGE